MRGLAPRPQKWSPEPRSPPKLTEPLCNLAKSTWEELNKLLGSQCYNIPSNHLMPTFQQEFSLSWDCKNWLLTHERGQLSLEPACCSNQRLSWVCWVVGPLCLQRPCYLCSLFLTHSSLQYSVSGNSFLAHTQTSTTLPWWCDPSRLLQPALQQLPPSQLPRRPEHSLFPRSDLLFPESIRLPCYLLQILLQCYLLSMVLPGYPKIVGPLPTQPLILSVLFPWFIFLLSIYQYLTDCLLFFFFLVYQLCSLLSCLSPFRAQTS